MKKLISHEMPYELMVSEHHDKINDYLYVLLHKMIQDKDYREFCLAYKAKPGFKTIYLDNSCYELGGSLDNNILHEYDKLLNPDILILPDVLGEQQDTITRTVEYLDEHPEAAGYGMAVIQGASFDEMIECYQYFRDYRNADDMDITMIGIPFVFSWVEKSPYMQTLTRMKLLRYLSETKILDKNRRHHLLGTWQPYEFLDYQEYNWITSIDTSNPIMAAIDGMKYEDFGITEKPRSTFDSTYHKKISDLDLGLLYYNVNTFKRIVNDNGF